VRKNKKGKSMLKVSKWVMLISLICVIICFCCAVWMSIQLRDWTSYGVTIVFALAIVWLVINLLYSIKKEKKHHHHHHHHHHSTTAQS